MNLIYHSDTSPRGFWQKRFGPIAGSFIAFLVEVIQIVIISAAIIIPVRYFLIQPFYVKGASMEPTFFEKEYLRDMKSLGIDSVSALPVCGSISSGRGNSSSR